MAVTLCLPLKGSVRLIASLSDIRLFAHKYRDKHVLF
jgi:hypothetical protein